MVIEEVKQPEEIEEETPKPNEFTVKGKFAVLFLYSYSSSLFCNRNFISPSSNP